MNSISFEDYSNNKKIEVLITWKGYYHLTIFDLSKIYNDEQDVYIHYDDDNKGCSITKLDFIKQKLIELNIVCPDQFWVYAEEMKNSNYFYEYRNNKWFID